MTFFIHLFKRVSCISCLGLSFIQAVLTPCISWIVHAVVTNRALANSKAVSIDNCNISRQLIVR